MKKELIPARIAQSIYFLRGQKVILDFDLAQLYGVAAKALNQAVKRNRERFPEDFMFQLTQEETRILRSQSVISSTQAAKNKEITTNRSQFVTSSFKHRERKSRPYAFTEQGVAMLSSVLNWNSGERTRLACWRWRPRHRELCCGIENAGWLSLLPAGFSARRRKQHARRVCSPIRNHR